MIRVFVILFYIFLGISHVTAQKLIVCETLKGKIKVPIPSQWEKIDDDISKSIRPNRSTYNIISFFSGSDPTENLVTLYGDSALSKLVFQDEEVRKLNKGFIDKVLLSHGSCLHETQQ